MTGKPAGPARGILLVGCGKMGGALLAGWKRRRLTQPLAVVEPQPVALPPGVKRYAAPDGLPRRYAPAAVVLAVKPQSLAATLPAYQRLADGNTVFLSIAAGKTLRFFARALGEDAALVRAMPNTPAAIGRGIAVACANDRVTAAQRALCFKLLGAVGEVAWVEDEALLDPVTAVSGSGPAYVFLLIECLAEAGIAAGLPGDLAMTLARATVAGSGELARRSSEDAAQLRRNVTSPGGTTEAALKVLMGDGGLATLMRRAIAAATARSRALAD
ncbi:MAG TPA: pyrroline-5-carboxylate reductase [Stellaceae bacterium]|nr:pyrroline-5-carboxylate reductase [Stellaceae bacterium]